MAAKKFAWRMEMDEDVAADADAVFERRIE